METRVPLVKQHPNFRCKIHLDHHRLKFGVRSVTYNNTDGVLINHRKFYFTGFGRHEDSDIRGKGLDSTKVHSSDATVQNHSNGN